MTGDNNAGVMNCGVEIAVQPAVRAANNKPAFTVALALDADGEGWTGREFENDCGHDVLAFAVPLVCGGSVR